MVALGGGMIPWTKGKEEGGMERTEQILRNLSGDRLGTMHFALVFLLPRAGVL